MSGHRAFVLLGTQTLFNTGFYAVVPFLAVVLRDDLLLSGAAIGLVLGARTFAQQGLFLLGGSLADRYGARRMILIGCGVRVLGFGLLTMPGSPGPFIVGVLLTGVAGALFSPALETLVARADAERPAARSSLFAGLAIAGELGAALGPALGVLLIDHGFAVTAGAGAALFTGILIALATLLPADQPVTTRRAQRREHGIWPSLGDRRFVVFCAFSSVALLAYNQLYLGLPVELDRAGAADDWLGTAFVVVAAATVVAQVPLARWARGRGGAIAVPAGFAVMGSAFAIVAVAATATPAPGWEAMPALALAVVLVTGHMLVVPATLAGIPAVAAGRPTGSYYGLLATMGGIAVLLGNTLLGPLYDLARDSSLLAATPWSVLAALCVVAAIGVHRAPLEPRIVPGRPPTRSEPTAVATPAPTLRPEHDRTA